MYLFKIKTPLGINVRTTEDYWSYLVEKKHRIMKGRQNIVKEILSHPDEIRCSKMDKDIFLYYKRFERLYCVVARHTEKTEGFLITAYPVDKIKEGEIVWKK